VAEPVRIGELVLQTDPSAGDWVLAGVDQFGTGVSSLLPPSFDAYARVFHPAHRGDEAVRWSHVAAANERLAHPAMEWISITGSWQYLHGETQPPIWDEEPREGSLPRPEIERLATLLGEHTATPDQCWFAVWEGFGALPFDPGEFRKLELEHRAMVLFSGPLSAAMTSVERWPWEQSPSLWWPADRAWCVATDVDLMTTYVGASRRCVIAITTDPNLEALAISVDQGVTWDTDVINPAPVGANPYA
jgi:hypothetical protein